MKAISIVLEREILWAKEKHAMVAVQLSFCRNLVRLKKLRNIVELLKQLEHSLRGTIACGGVCTSRGRIYLASTQRLIDSVALGMIAARCEGGYNYSLFQNLSNVYNLGAFSLKQSILALNRGDGYASDVWQRADTLFCVFASKHNLLKNVHVSKTELDNFFSAQSTGETSDLIIEGEHHSMVVNWQHRAWAYETIAKTVKTFTTNLIPTNFAALKIETTQKAAAAKEIADQYRKVEAARLAGDSCVRIEAIVVLRESIVDMALCSAEMHASAYPARLEEDKDTHAYEWERDLQARCMCWGELVDALETRYRQRQALDTVPAAAEIAIVKNLLNAWDNHWAEIILEMTAAPLLCQGQDWLDHYSRLWATMKSSLTLPEPEELHCAVYFAQRARAAQEHAKQGEVYQLHHSCWQEVTRCMDAFLVCDATDDVSGATGASHNRLVLRAKDFANLAEGMCTHAVEYVEQARRRNGESAQLLVQAAVLQAKAVNLQLEDMNASTYPYGGSPSKTTILKLERAASDHAMLADLVWRAGRENAATPSTAQCEGLAGQVALVRQLVLHSEVELGPPLAPALMEAHNHCLQLLRQVIQFFQMEILSSDHAVGLFDHCAAQTDSAALECKAWAKSTAIRYSSALLRRSKLGSVEFSDRASFSAPDFLKKAFANFFSALIVQPVDSTSNGLKQQLKRKLMDIQMEAVESFLEAVEALEEGDALLAGRWQAVVGQYEWILYYKGIVDKPPPQPSVLSATSCPALESHNSETNLSQNNAPQQSDRAKKKYNKKRIRTMERRIAELKTEIAAPQEDWYGGVITPSTPWVSESANHQMDSRL